MSNNEQTDSFKNIERLSMDELTSHHQDLEEKYKNTTAGEVDDQTKALMAFNGYYSMSMPKTAAGAFFSIDTNMHINEKSPTPNYDVSLIISMDGHTSTRFQFSGTKGQAGAPEASFINDTLKLSTPAILAGNSLELSFTRTGLSEGVTASFSGSITYQGEQAVNVTGQTYNNIIPSTMYSGKFHTEALGVIPGKEVMQIKKDFSLLYDYGSGTGELTQVPSYTYNMNMYFFSVSKDGKTSKLIMGTSGNCGLICNDMIVDNATNKVTTRSLQTLAIAGNISTKHKNNPDGEKLAAFSGYYPMPTVSENAFVSIAGQYSVSPTNEKEYKVLIGISLDGAISDVYTFDTAMTFEDNTFAIWPEEVSGIPTFSMKFKQEYKQQGNFGSLVTATISGAVMDKPVTAYSALGPVPLLAFGGATMNNKKGTEPLEINSNHEVTYKGMAGLELLYVPLMYILEFKVNHAQAPEPPKLETIVLSLGTDGGKGTACIVNAFPNGITKPPVISTVFGIPSGTVNAGVNPRLFAAELE